MVTAIAATPILTLRHMGLTWALCAGLQEGCVEGHGHPERHFAGACLVVM